jgi:SAM-dependent methyltransferase
MVKKDDSLANALGNMGDRAAWFLQLEAVAQRFDREYQGKAVELPDEVQAMPIFREWSTGGLTSRIASPFWQLATPKKGQHCLDLGCGVSFLIYPWRDWNAYFYGQDISAIACQTLTSRAPQLNSKLFKGAIQAPAHQLAYDNQRFDLVISTGVSCYYTIDYWQAVLEAVRRVLQPGGVFIFDVVNPEAELAENWAILETYLGAEVMLADLSDWTAMIKQAGGKVAKQLDHELFHLFKVQFPTPSPGSKNPK